MKKLKKNGLDLCHVTSGGPLEMDEHKHDEHEDIEKKVGIFNILYGILAKTRNLNC